MSKGHIAILNYGLGNIGSLKSTLSYLDFQVSIASGNHDIPSGLTAFVLPGVGAFPAGMRGLQDSGLDLAIQELVASKIPGLGICLGMQLMAEWGVEGGQQVNGLGLFDGGVVPLPSSSASVPHIGWSQTQSAISDESWQSCLVGDFYYVHSFVLQPTLTSAMAATFLHGEHSCCAAVYRPGLLGVQFHPEKSQQSGLALIDAYLSYPHSLH